MDSHTALSISFHAFFLAAPAFISFCSQQLLLQLTQAFARFYPTLAHVLTCPYQNCCQHSLNAQGLSQLSKKISAGSLLQTSRRGALLRLRQPTALATRSSKPETMVFRLTSVRPKPTKTLACQKRVERQSHEPPTLQLPVLSAADIRNLSGPFRLRMAPHAHCMAQQNNTIQIRSAKRIQQSDVFPAFGLQWPLVFATASGI